MADNKFISWMKAHKIATGAIGCGGILLMGVVLVTVLGLILMATGNVPEPEAAPSSTATAPKVPKESPNPTRSEVSNPAEPPTPTETPTKKTEPTKKAEPKKTEKPKADLVERVKDSVASNFGLSDLSEACSEVGYDSWTCLATEWTEPVEGTVVVKIQMTEDSLPADYGEDTARGILNLVGQDVKDLDMVQVVDATGKSMGIVSRSEAPLADR